LSTTSIELAGWRQICLFCNEGMDEIGGGGGGWVGGGPADRRNGTVVIWAGGCVGREEEGMSGRGLEAVDAEEELPLLLLRQ
jgi:hypothetical protein